MWLESRVSLSLSLTGGILLGLLHVAFHLIVRCVGVRVAFPMSDCARPKAFADHRYFCLAVGLFPFRYHEISVARPFDVRHCPALCLFLSPHHEMIRGVAHDPGLVAFCVRLPEIVHDVSWPL